MMVVLLVFWCFDGVDVVLELDRVLYSYTALVLLILLMYSYAYSIYSYPSTSFFFCLFLSASFNFFQLLCSLHTPPQRRPTKSQSQAIHLQRPAAHDGDGNDHPPGHLPRRQPRRAHAVPALSTVPGRDIVGSLW